MDAKAQLADRIEQLEHMNMKLETETETIGEYIALYQTQRQALKAKFAEKDSVITQLSNEHARMQVSEYTMFKALICIHSLMFLYLHMRPARIALMQDKINQN